MSESSPDLSLRLRRGSSDSRDSFYMDFAQGIDSDIEEIARPVVNCALFAGDHHDDHRVDMEDEILPFNDICQTIPEEVSEELGEEADEEDKMKEGETRHPEQDTEMKPSEQQLKEPRTVVIKTAQKINDWPAFSAPLPSTSFQSAIIVSPETLSRNSSIPPSNSHQPVGQFSLPLACSSRSVCYPAPTVIEIAENSSRKHLIAYALATVLSALYGKLLVVIGIALPIAEVISSHIPPLFYEGFYLYLYFGSILFLLCMYALMLEDDKREQRNKSESSTNPDSNDRCNRAADNCTLSDRSSSKLGSNANIRSSQPFGSFYLRLGAVAFGAGSMIYSGLEFVQYFELKQDEKCFDLMLVLTPATRMAFIFIQMYFIFLNNEQIFKISSHLLLARFGLMHMIGTNLSVWLNVLVQETKHEILTFYNSENNSLKISHAFDQGGKLGLHFRKRSQSHHKESRAGVFRSLRGPYYVFECGRANILGSLVQDASPFLFPCTIAYSLICAAILYVIWKNIARASPSKALVVTQTQLSVHTNRGSLQDYSFDFTQANTGIFVGIFILVLTIISLILFFVLISHQQFVNFAVAEVNICELSLYGISTLATIVGMFKMRKLKFNGMKDVELDNILLLAAQTGNYSYSTFIIIGHLTFEKHTILVLITALAGVIQTTFQTIFILDALRRSVYTSEQIRRKPGREIVTFLLVTNLAMWAINTLEKSRADMHPFQLHFYGLWAWTIITHTSMPLAIFYRFHSTVCLCEVWKKVYNIKPTRM